MSAPLSASSSLAGIPRRLPPLQRSVREPLIDYRNSLFGPYQRYYSNEFRLPIDRLRSIKKGEMVIQPSRVANNRYIVIFQSRDDIPYIKTVDADEGGFICDKIRFPFFGSLLSKYDADVFVDPRIYSYPAVIQGLPLVLPRVAVVEGSIFGSAPMNCQLNPAMLMPPPPPRIAYASILPKEVQEQTMPAPQRKEHLPQ